jgi:hypothetical protein
LAVVRNRFLVAIASGRTVVSALDSIISPPLPDINKEIRRRYPFFPRRAIT